MEWARLHLIDELDGIKEEKVVCVRISNLLASNHGRLESGMACKAVKTHNGENEPQLRDRTNELRSAPHIRQELKIIQAPNAMAAGRLEVVGRLNVADNTEVAEIGAG